MGIQIVRVPPGYQHPTGSDGEYIDGAHLEPLWHMSADQKSCYQIYQNVSEGTPVSPIFQTEEELCQWMVAHGESPEAAAAFLETGHAPSLVVSSDALLSGPEGLAAAKRSDGPPKESE
jgi:hypothetical protein